MAYTVEKHRGLWWVIDNDGYEARAVGYDTKKEALVSARICEKEDAADRANAFIVHQIRRW